MPNCSSAREGTSLLDEALLLQSSMVMVQVKVNSAGKSRKYSETLVAGCPVSELLNFGMNHCSCQCQSKRQENMYCDQLASSALDLLCICSVLI